VPISFLLIGVGPVTEERQKEGVCSATGGAVIFRCSHIVAFLGR
jgi:hypothetical protein